MVLHFIQTSRPVRHGLMVALTCLLVACGGGGGSEGVAAAPEPDAVSVGQRIFTDTNLSSPAGTACVSCHAASQGFAGNNGSTIGVALGSKSDSLGLRNAMTNSYSGLIPPFSFIQAADGKFEAEGGLLWDGRADTLEAQASGPFAHPLEMNTTEKEVVDKIAGSRYADMFKRVFGAQIFADTSAAFAKVTSALAEFQRATLQPFSSKYDAMVRGELSLSVPEARGMALFMDPAKGNCAGCHLMNPGSGKPADSMFTEFTYYATGVPRNTAIPMNADPAFYDLGLCGPARTPPVLPQAVLDTGVTIDNFCGMFRMPTLRNVAERPAFMHNGFFKNLHEVVRFYATRNSDPVRWYGGAGTPNDLPAKYLANIESVKAPFDRLASQGSALTEREIDDIVTFMRTLSDGYKAP
jgi:cytochrome c peroxidase